MRDFFESVIKTGRFVLSEMEDRIDKAFVMGKISAEDTVELKELAAEDLTIEMSMYGGFEQVGSIGQSLPRNDTQTTTASGDIVLYSGDQLVVFYGSNTWAYTRLGKIVDKTPEEMEELLGNGDVTITLSKR